LYNKQLITIFVKVGLVSKLRDSSMKSVVWMLLLTVFTIKSCDFLLSYYPTLLSYNIEDDTNEETQSGDTNDDCLKESAKKLFPFSEDNEGYTSLTWHTSLSIHWCIYSFTIFKEPLRDVLTPPPNSLFYI
jgi:hypothetical protein